MNDSPLYNVPHEPGRWRAIVLALLVHGALLALLWFGVSWQSVTPVAVEAEVWNMKALEAAPRAKPVVALETKAETEPAPPTPKARAPRPAPAESVPPPIQNTPDIALERERATKERQRKREQEEAAKQRDRLAQQEEAARKEKQQKLQAQEKLQAQQKTQELQRLTQAADAAAKKKIDDQKKLAAAKATDKQRKDDALEDQKLAAQREDNLRRMTDSASVGSGGTGEAAKSQGSRADASYIQKVGAKIKSNTIFNGADELDSNPSAEFAVELLPDGSIRRLRKTKSSGVPGFDDAVSRAIEKSQPFPPDKSGSAPSGFTVSHKPKDQ